MDKSSMEGKYPIGFLVKCLLLSYIITALLLLILAFVLFKLGLTEGTVSIAISGVYVVSTFIAGYVAGKKIQNRKFLWGMALGAAYFLVLALISLLVNQSVGDLSDSFATTLVLCTAGGTMGGMLG